MSDPACLLEYSITNFYKLFEENQIDFINNDSDANDCFHGGISDHTSHCHHIDLFLYMSCRHVF